MRGPGVRLAEPGRSACRAEDTTPKSSFLASAEIRRADSRSEGATVSYWRSRASPSVRLIIVSWAGRRRCRGRAARVERASAATSRGDRGRRRLDQGQAGRGGDTAGAVGFVRNARYALGQGGLRSRPNHGRRVPPAGSPSDRRQASISSTARKTASGFRATHSRSGAGSATTASRVNLLMTRATGSLVAPASSTAERATFPVTEPAPNGVRGGDQEPPGLGVPGPRPGSRWRLVPLPWPACVQRW